jgi:hypothetical protein
VIPETERKTGKEMLGRIVAMLTRMTHSSQVREEGAVYGYVNEYEYGEEGYYLIA